MVAGWIIGAGGGIGSYGRNVNQTHSVAHKVHTRGARRWLEEHKCCCRSYR
ncbi:hypothetical protein [Porphyromonas gingivalis]|uniref:hypothetical protein n=1 Tax=Porphyromonas gingivalis TaxID=837 RepID=UPI001F386436|nr:hypothetical protein [Porphyromonas gingivalis]